MEVSQNRGSLKEFSGFKRFGAVEFGAAGFLNMGPPKLEVSLWESP